MSDYNNYLVGDNPFHLAGPPDYWLKALHDFDNSLVVIPSKQGYFYRIGQRRPPVHSTKVVNEIMKENADSHMLAANNLVPVTTLLAATNWSNYPLHFEELRRRATWRNGGAEAYIKKLEQQEWEDELKQRDDFDKDVLSPLSNDAWGLYNKKLGLRSHMYIPKTKSSLVHGKPRPSKAPNIQVNSSFVA